MSSKTPGRWLVVIGLAAVGPVGLVIACGDSTNGGGGTAPTATGTTTGQPTATATGTTKTQPTSTSTTPTPIPDAGVDAAKYCDLGVARGDGLGGQAALFDKQGNPLPSGRYRIRYVDGCMRYGGGQSFTVHAYEPGADASVYATWNLVSSPDGGFVQYESGKLPGLWIFGPDASTLDASAQYVSCVEANLATPALELEYDAGRRLGVQLNDSPLGDNDVGPDGGPTWRLELWSPTGVCP